MIDKSGLSVEDLSIKVVGVGGAGGNFVKQMINSNVKGVEYYLVNTEKAALKNDGDCKTIQIGRELTGGLGAGANPEIGEKAAIESIAEIEKMLEGTDLLFLTAGMGGGTGTGAIPVIAEIAKKKGILTVGVVTLPFPFEGRVKTTIANIGVERLKPYVNALIIISNTRLVENSKGNITILNAFKLTDDILRQSVQAITDLIFTVGTINVDFADIKTILSCEGYSYMGIGQAKGDNRVEEATREALANPLTERGIYGAKGVIFNVKGGENIGLDDITKSAELIAEKVSPDANIIFGTVIDEDLDEDVIVTVVATGVEEHQEDRRKKL